MSIPNYSGGPTGGHGTRHDRVLLAWSDSGRAVETPGCRVVHTKSETGPGASPSPTFLSPSESFGVLRGLSVVPRSTFVESKGVPEVGFLTGAYLRGCKSWVPYDGLVSKSGGDVRFPGLDDLVPSLRSSWTFGVGREEGSCGGRCCVTGRTGLLDYLEKFTDFPSGTRVPF